MIVVAVVAVGINVVMVAMTMSQRAVALRRRAQQEALHERSFGVAVTQDGMPVAREELLRLNQQWFAYHGMLRRKYEYAASHPWLPVPEDPPDPVANGTPGREVRPWTEP